MNYGTKHYAARLEELTEANEFVAACADRIGFDADRKFELLLVFEEAFVNVCSYAYAAAAGTVEVRCDADGSALVLTIVDQGTPFDLRSMPEPDAAASSISRQHGGLGVHFIRSLADRVSYNRENNRNILQLTFLLRTKP